MARARPLLRILVLVSIIIAGVSSGQIYYTSRLSQGAPIGIPDISAKILAATSRDIILTLDGRQIPLEKTLISSWIESHQRNYTGRDELQFSSEKVHRFISSLAPQFDIPTINARFRIEDGRAVEFAPATEGKTLNIDDSTGAVLSGLINGNAEIALAIDYEEPTITLDKINSLGISTRLSIGESNFVGSSAGRVKNIRISSSKYNGYILEPGEEFSFNKVLGVVDGTSGYVAEKVIKGHSLVYEYGGGICQVATTMFRAAILAGFPILERKPHSFPVLYYNPQGFDATVYPGVSDLRFINSTPNHVLIQTSVVGTKLIFEIYGSDDGRKVTMDGPYQYDKMPDGSMKAYFTRTISYEGIEPKQDKFYSSYHSPALYPLQRNPLE